MLHFLIGAAYSGKTKALYDLTRTLCGKGRRVLFFVPEQQTAAVEADLLRHCSNRAGQSLEVLNFQRLPNRIFREIGGLCLPSASPVQKSLLLAQVIREQKDELPIYSRYAKNADFILEAGAFIDEICRSGMSAAALSALAESSVLKGEGTLPEKLREAALLYASYDALYRETCGKSPDDAARLAEALSDNPNYNFFDGATVILDGFYDFTAPQYDLICHMANAADEVYLSSLDDGRDALLFERTRGARRLLKARLETADYEEITPEDMGVALRKEGIPEDLGFLCDHILLNPEKCFDTVPNRISVTRCKTPLDEVRFALREVVHLHEEKGVPYAECAILYRDTALYTPLLKELANSYKIPLYTDEETALSDSPLALFFLAAADLAAPGGKTEDFFALLSTGLCPVSDKLALNLERYIRTWKLPLSRILSEDDFTASAFGFADLITPNQRAENEEILASLNREKHKILRPIAKLKTAFRTAKTAAEKTEALFAFAKSLKVDETYSTLVDALREAGEFSAAAETESIFGVCLETLEALSQMKGSTEDDFFRELLRLAFSFGSVGSLPSSPEALAAGDVTFTRLKKVRHLFLIGVATDSFPRSTATAPLFSVRERALISRLGDDSPLFFAKPTHDLTREEYFLFYLAASVPRDALHLTYPAQNLDGSLARASIFITRIKHLFPALTESEFDEEAALPLSASELYRYLNRTKNETDDFTRFARALYKKYAALPCPKSDEETAKCRDRLTVGDEAASITVSQAKLAAYAKCPYSYFLQYKLFLSEEPQAKPDASLRGTIVHNALEHLFYPLSQGRLFKPKLDAITPEEIDREFDAQHRALTDAGYEPDEWDERWFDDLRRTTHRLVHSMKEELRVGEFRPAFFEADLMRTLTPIERILKNGTKMRISGKADRIDLARDAESGRVFARVVDYKTGEHNMDRDELLNGFDTQLLLYLFTLSENGIGKEYPSITPAAAYYLRAHTPPASAREADAKKDSVDACTFLRSGVFLSEPEAIRASVCEGATDKDNLSIHYDSKGMPKSSGILADGEQMQILSDAVLNYAKDTAEDIVDGKFACLPLWKDEDTNESCEYCPYHAICRYEGEAIRLQKKANKDTFFADLKEGGIHRG